MVCEKTLPIDNGTRSNKINFAVGVVLDDTLDAKASAPSESEMRILRLNQYSEYNSLNLYNNHRKYYHQRNNT